VSDLLDEDAFEGLKTQVSYGFCDKNGPIPRMSVKTSVLASKPISKDLEPGIPATRSPRARLAHFRVASALPIVH
jgi:hypothetical protein